LAGAGSEAWQTYVADAIAKAPAKPSGTEKQAIKIMTGADR